jgi:hypothetical protein
MNINPEYSNDNPPSATQAMDEAMDYLWQTLIKPNEANLDIEDATLLAMIGAMFKDIAKDAEAYHKIQFQGFEENLNSRN